MGDGEEQEEAISTCEEEKYFARLINVVGRVGPESAWSARHQPALLLALLRAKLLPVLITLLSPTMQPKLPYH